MAFSPSDHTFVICAYKENPFLEETILSLKNQSKLGSIIMSTSTPNEHIKGLAEKHDISLTVNPSPLLAGDDWNWGYNQASTPLVTMAHQDDIYDANFLGETLRAINESDPEKTSLAFTDYYEIRGDDIVRDNSLLKIKRVMNAPFKGKHLGASRLVKRRIMGLGCSICCPSATFNKDMLGASIFDTTYINSCDYKTWVDLASRDGRFLYIPEQLIGHRIYAESATSKNLSENIRIKEDEEILSTLWPKPIAKLINSAYALSENSNEL